MSALSHLASPDTLKYPSVYEHEFVQPFELPDGTPYKIRLSIKRTVVPNTDDALFGNNDAPIVKVSLETAHPTEWVDAKAHLEVKQPLPPFPNPASEPDDHSFAFRCERFAVVVPLEAGNATEKQLWTLFYAFFTLWPSQEYFTLASDSGLIDYLVHDGLATLHPATRQPEYCLISRAAFWQGCGFPSRLAPWILPKADSFVASALLSSNVNLPAPPGKPRGIIYSRYIPGLNSRLTFRVASSQKDADVDILTRWHATDRVNNGWRQRLSREEQIKTIQATEQNPFSIGLIGEWDGEPWGYVEIYYAKQSNLASQYNADTHDRGFHALVGEEKFRGPHRVRSWMGSVVHVSDSTPIESRPFLHGLLIQPFILCSSCSFSTTRQPAECPSHA